MAFVGVGGSIAYTRCRRSDAAERLVPSHSAVTQFNRQNRRRGVGLGDWIGWHERDRASERERLGVEAKVRCGAATAALEGAIAHSLLQTLEAHGVSLRSVGGGLGHRNVAGVEHRAPEGEELVHDAWHDATELVADREHGAGTGVGRVLGAELLLSLRY